MSEKIKSYRDLDRVQKRFILERASHLNGDALDGDSIEYLRSLVRGKFGIRISGRAVKRFLRHRRYHDKKNGSGNRTIKRAGRPTHRRLCGRFVR